MKDLTKTENILVNFHAIFFIAPVMVNPLLLITSMSLFVAPSSLLDANPWYLPVPLFGLFILVVLYIFYSRMPTKYRIVVWLLSFLYWVGWCIYFLTDLKPFLEHWIIWGPHLLMVLASAFGFYHVINTKFKQVSVAD